MAERVRTFTKEEIEKANSLDIVEVAEKLELPLLRHGRTVMTHCLWHSERNPSLQVGGKDGYKSQCRCYVCQRSHGVVDLVMAAIPCDFRQAMAWLMEKYGIGSQTVGETAPVGKRERKVVNRPQLNYGTMQEMARFVSLQNALANCLMQRFPREVVTRVSWDYMLGVDYEVCHYDHTLFPSIDIEGRVHNVKAQGYVTCPTHERFGHSTKGDTYWVGQRLLPGRDCDTQCLFGEHLLRRYPNRVVVLVESPKNAVVGACRYPDLLWVATGNKGMLKRELLEVLRGRKVIVIPDRDAIDEWRQKIQGMQDIATLQLSTFCHCQEDEGNRKMDIADLILSK